MPRSQTISLTVMRKRLLLPRGRFKAGSLGWGTDADRRLLNQIGNGHAQNRGCADGVNAIDHGADLHPGIFHSAFGIDEEGKDAGAIVDFLRERFDRKK